MRLENMLHSLVSFVEDNRWLICGENMKVDCFDLWILLAVLKMIDEGLKQNSGDAIASIFSMHAKR